MWMATTKVMRDKLLNSGGSGEEAMSRLVVEFFDEIVADLQSRTGSHVPYKSLIELRAAYMPDAVRAGLRLPPS